MEDRIFKEVDGVLRQCQFCELSYLERIRVKRLVYLHDKFIKKELAELISRQKSVN